MVTIIFFYRMFTKTLSHFYFIVFYFYNEFTYTKCSLLSRVKNPLEHFSDTTISYMLPKNIYRYEPYRGHRTLWRPTSKNSATPKQDRPLTPRTRATVYKQQYKQQVSRQHMKVSTKKSYWHHFDEEEEAWPKVVLVLSSTEITTTPKKVKKTFASYFPQIYKNIPKENADPDDQNNTGEDETGEMTLKNDDSGMNWIPLNFETTGDSAHMEEEEEMDSEEAEESVDITTTIRNTDITPSKSKSTTTDKMNMRAKGFPQLLQTTTVTTTTEPTTISQVIIVETWPPTTTEESTTTTTTISSTTPTKPTRTTDSTTATTDSMTTTTDSSATTTDSTANTTTSTTTTTPRPPARCYQCGLNDTDIPYAPTCHHIFGGQTRTYHHLKKYYKVVCENKRRKRAVDFDPTPKKTYKGGCFKRFLDIGEVYNERGCRTMDPLLGVSFVSVRLMLLEKSMHSLDEGCISSPHASLTPFSRAISLYTRYHVCVCIGNYCNSGKALYMTSMFILCSNIFLRILT